VGNQTPAQGLPYPSAIQTPMSYTDMHPSQIQLKYASQGLTHNNYVVTYLFHDRVIDLHLDGVINISKWFIIKWTVFTRHLCAFRTFVYRQIYYKW